jgi:class 3 adenylate cyclase/tetratricopeptide (TPR) repeat protein
LSSCPQCASSNPEGSRFCASCGAEFEISIDRAVCACGSPYLPEARYCSACGLALPGDRDADRAHQLHHLQSTTPRGLQRKIQAAQKETRGERKPVTILFCDIVGSTALAERLDPEDWREIVAGAHQVVAEIVYRYEGTIAQLLGDGVLAFFGAPVTHEDDPERAVHAGLEIQGAIQGYAQTLGDTVEDFRMRVGINSGEVVIGEIGSDLHMEYLAFGDAVNTAARLESAAAPGTVLVSAATEKSVRHLFDTEDVGAIAAKGKSEPVQAYHILAVKARPGRKRGIPGLEASLIGRDAELETLEGALSRLAAGEGGVVTLIGEAGIGKSRLMAELRRSPHARGIRWVEGRCLSYGSGTPYLPWIEIIRILMHVDVSAEPQAQTRQVRDRLGVLDPDLVNLAFPYVCHLLSLPVEGPEAAALHSLKGEDLKTATFHAVQVFLEAVAAEGPLVIVAEDFHWADATSVDLLQHLSSRTALARVLFVCVFRPEVDTPMWRMRAESEGDQPPRSTEVDLRPLTDADSKGLIENLLAVDVLPAELVGRILVQAEGNPFYVEELLRSFIDGGTLTRDEVSGHWHAAVDLTDLPVPDSLHAVIMARLDRLPDEPRWILQNAAVIGRRFDLELLGRIVDQPRPAFGRHMDTLETRQFVRPTANGASRPYAFKHALVQEVAYGVLLKKHRRELHGRVGAAIEEAHAGEMSETAEVLAHHFLEAEDWDRSWTYNLMAGEKARSNFSNPEAIAFFQTALSLVEHLPDLEMGARADVHRSIAATLAGINQYDDALIELDRGLALLQAADPTDSVRAATANLQGMVGQVQRSNGEYEGAIATFEGALHHLPDGQLRERGALLIGLASALTRQGELERAESICREGIAASAKAGDDAELAHAYSLLGTIRRDQGDTQESLEHRLKSLEISERIHSIPLQMEAHNNLAVAHYDLGEYARSVHHYEQSRSLSERIGNLNTAARAQVNLGEVQLIWGDWDPAERAFREALEIWEGTGYLLGQAYAASNIGAVLTRKGKAEDALRYLDRSREIFEEIGARGFMPSVLRRQATVHAELDELARAEELCTRALELARELSMHAEEAAALRTCGRVLRELGEHEQARQELDRSVEIFHEADIQYEEARSLRERARLLLVLDQAEAAASDLSQAIEQFTRLDARADLAEAQRLQELIGQ